MFFKKDDLPDDTSGWQVVTETQPSEDVAADLAFAWDICRFVKSNAIVLVRDGALVGVVSGSDLLAALAPVLDPQGDAVRRSLSSLGFEEVKSARVGKLIELELDGNDRDNAEAHIQSMCEKLLANPVIEDFRIETVEEG